ncbi:MAG TPA: HNH endonuclease, partial [Ilumatobacteraceae bacterium]|nr:HNH endonuclease [Ilumatobacteraceae bacterium]
MDAVAVAERVHRIVAVRDDAAASDDLIESGLVAVREVQAWADAQHGALVAKLSADGFAEARVAKASKTSLGGAVKVTQRSRTLAATPKLAGALGDGGTTAAHIDVVTRAATQLPAAQRDELLAQADRLVAVAAVSTPEQFARRVALEVKRIQADDGIDRLARQRRNVRVSTWV